MDPINSCIDHFCGKTKNSRDYFPCLYAYCPKAITKVRKDLNIITSSAVTKPTLESSRLLTTEYCARFLCGNQQLGVPCMQFACRWRSLGEETEPLYRDASTVAKLASLCSRVVCSDDVTAATSRRVVLPGRHDVVAAKRLSKGDLRKCRRCRAFSGDFRRREACTKWCFSLHP